MANQYLDVRWYADDGSAVVFAKGGESLAIITGGHRAQVTQRLKQLGLRPKRWRRADWGFFSTLERL